ncbi:dCMP deaminase [Streptomyces oryzae]|uniref:dCMP deaminase n=1 Tax=Streptomyces oryzae TaxID=1434886 RepID=A0ABS3X7Q0_9ACTN|nr:deaminase [Streptomyces oryzae]MBO8191381.1 dCMP deaminase [Streptomyces oryzae]
MSAEPSESDEYWMRRAIELSRLCPPSQTAFSVGAVIVDADGNEIANGYSRETGPHVHAEESALAKLADEDPRLGSATIYSTLEPCAKRRSRPQTCTELILAAGIPRVVIAWREPDLFVTDVDGVEILRGSGVSVPELPHLSPAAREVNAHLPGIAG